MEPSTSFFSSYSRTLTLALWRLKRDACSSSSSLSSVTQGPLTSDLKSASLDKSPGILTPRRKLPRLSTWVIVACILLSATTLADACGPGRGNGRRRAPRKLTPIVYKQHVPNVPENALSASGISEGKILRGDTQRFKDLVPNYNPDILFRDDEGTGADRLMTQKLREKLNTLGISVMNQWPGVKLRVIEGWDEEHLHSPNSLHYEGRAVDIQTSDKDWSKYGMLARLAVEAGFDWVFYESRAHIHCSVKSDSFQSGRAGGCFNSNSTVQTINGKKNITDLSIGDQVLTVDLNGEVAYAPVILFLDRNHTQVREFYEIETSNHQTLRLTPSHLLFIIPATTALSIQDFLTSDASSSEFRNGGNSEIPFSGEELSNAELVKLAEITFARNVAIGDWILIVDSNEKVERSRVLSVRSFESQGVYAPLTTTGTIVVDGVLSSCYAVIDSQSLAHASFLPFRLVHNLMAGVNRLWRKATFLVTLGTSDTQSAEFSRVVNSLSQQRSAMTERPEVKGSDNDEGVFWYASFLYDLTNRILPSSLLYH